MKAAGAANWVEFALDEFDLSRPVELVVPRRCRLQVDLSDSTLRADSMGLRNAAGEPVAAVITRGSVAFGCTRIELTPTGSEAVSTTEDAVVAVFFQAGVELARLPLEFAPPRADRAAPVK